VHARAPEALPANYVTERSHSRLMYWRTDGYFHYCGIVDNCFPYHPEWLRVPEPP